MRRIDVRQDLDGIVRQRRDWKKREGDGRKAFMNQSKERERGAMGMGIINKGKNGENKITEIRIIISSNIADDGYIYELI